MKKMFFLMGVIGGLSMCLLSGCYNQPEYNAEVEKAQNMAGDNEERVKSIEEINEDAQRVMGGSNEN